MDSYVPVGEKAKGRVEVDDESRHIKQRISFYIQASIAPAVLILLFHAYFTRVLM